MSYKGKQKQPALFAEIRLKTEATQTQKNFFSLIDINVTLKKELTRMLFLGKIVLIKPYSQLQKAHDADNFFLRYGLWILELFIYT